MGDAPKPIVVIGSVNMDLVCRAPRIPAPGETIIGKDLVTIPGGKGANQAVAAAKLASTGTDVCLVARVGDDDFGRRLLDGLSQHGVCTEYVSRTRGVASGCAMILVDEKGENSIVVAPGANAKLTSTDVDRARAVIRRAAVVVLQLETPLATVRHAISTCRALGVPTILDPAPVPPRGLPRELYRVDVLTPNETEAGLLLGRDRDLRPEEIARRLLSRGPGSVVLKLGDKGAVWRTANGHSQWAGAFTVKAVDSTAAGDAFTAALAIARAEGLKASQTLRFANAAGALCCTRLGAQPSLPDRGAVERMLRDATNRGHSVKKSRSRAKRGGSEG